MSRLPHLVSRLQGFGTTIFSEMTALAVRHGAVNLGQGFPDFEGPEWIKRAAIEAIEAGHNQYSRSFGLPVLIDAIAAHQKRFWGVEYDAHTEVTVYNGATEAIFASLAALCETGDEVIVFEPYYDSYRASISMAGARERIVSLEAPDFSFDEQALRKAFTPKTRAILLNTPHNPTGKVFSKAELELIASLCIEHDVLCITDEVYEHLVYDGEHICIASLPKMRERTVVISSAGKTFSFTGWKIGHTCAPPELTKALRTAHQFITFCNGTPFQPAVAKAYGADDQFYADLTSMYRRKRDKLADGLREVGFEVLSPAGSYFVLADIRPLGFTDDVEFCRMLPVEYGVAAIPPSVFYANPEKGKHLVRFAFCKTDGVLDAALSRLAPLSEQRK